MEYVDSLFDQSSQTRTRAHTQHRGACGRPRAVIPAKILTLLLSRPSSSAEHQYFRHIIFSKNIFEFTAGNVDWRSPRVPLRGRINNGTATLSSRCAKLSLLQEWKCYLLPKDIWSAIWCMLPLRPPPPRNSRPIPVRGTRDLRAIVRVSLPFCSPRNPFMARAVWLLDLLYYAYTKHIGSPGPVVDAKFFDAGNSIPFDRLWNKNCDEDAARISRFWGSARKFPWNVRRKRVYAARSLWCFRKLRSKPRTRWSDSVLVIPRAIVKFYSIRSSNLQQLTTWSHKCKIGANDRRNSLDDERISDREYPIGIISEIRNLCLKLEELE